MTSAALLFVVGRHDAVGAYYLLQFRFWELGVGYNVAVLATSDEVERRFHAPYLARQIASVLALALIAFVAAGVDVPQTELAIAIATLSCAVLIWFNSADEFSGDTLTASVCWPHLRSEVWGCCPIRCTFGIGLYLCFSFA